MTAQLAVLEQGLLVTVQDFGRYGFQELGVPVAGALDPVGLRLANALVGNAGGEAGLEICYLGPTLRVEASSVRLAVFGDAQIVLKDSRYGSRRVEPYRSYLLSSGDEIAIGPVSDSTVAYLAVAGGFALEPVLGSASTYVRGRLGPLGGSPLKAGMALPLRRDEAETRPEVALARPMEYGQGPVRVILGPQDDAFTDASLKLLLSSEYTVTKETDRMGMRLEGPQLHHRDRPDIPSDAVVNGCIQVPGSGQPIVLLADHQTTGGYAKIATVISADLPRIGRAVPGTRVRFQAVSIEQAEKARGDLEKAIERCIAGIDEAGAADLTRLVDRLWSSNLVSGVVDVAEGRFEMF